MITFKESDFPNMATHCPQSACGFSLYRGVLVQWDEDHDERVLRVIDEMTAEEIDRLLVVQEHEGVIAFVWDGYIPEGYEEGGPGITEPEGDYWSVASSVALQSDRLSGGAAAHGNEACLDVLQRLTARCGMVLNGVAEQVELFGLMDEAKELLRANGK